DDQERSRDEDPQYPAETPHRLSRLRHLTPPRGAGAARDSPSLIPAGGLNVNVAASNFGAKFQSCRTAVYCGRPGASRYEITTLRISGTLPSATHICTSTASVSSSRW